MNTEELNMTTQDLIKHLQQLMPLGPQSAMLVTAAADRLEELQRLNDSMQTERNIEKKRADGHYENYCEMLKRIDVVAKERDEARAHLATFEPTIRNLTKQRDEARAEVERLNQLKTDWNADADYWKAETNLALKQRNEARSSANQWKADAERFVEQGNEARAEVERVKEEQASQKGLIPNFAYANGALPVRPEPSRLEIAAMFMISSMHPTGGVTSTIGERMKWAIAVADALIAAAREAK